MNKQEYDTGIAVGAAHCGAGRHHPHGRPSGEDREADASVIECCRCGASIKPEAIPGPDYIPQVGEGFCAELNQNFGTSYEAKVALRAAKQLAEGRQG
jgi:hypothetical protein